jgi:hypothetical protein
VRFDGTVSSVSPMSSTTPTAPSRIMAATAAEEALLSGSSSAWMLSSEYYAGDGTQRLNNTRNHVHAIPHAID